MAKGDKDDQAQSRVEGDPGLQAPPSGDQAPGQKFKVVANPGPVEELYVDGISGILGRAGVVKLDCYRVQGIDTADDNAEVRCVTHRLVIPTAVLPELIRMVKQLSESLRQPADKPASQDADPNLPE